MSVWLRVVLVCVLTPTAWARPAARPSKPAPVVLSRVVDPVGTKYQETKQAELAVVKGVRKMTRTSETRRSLEVLVAGPDAVKKARVRYAAFVPPKGGSGTAIVDRPYLLELVDGEVRITREDGVSPSADELSLLRDDNKRFGKPDEFAKAIVGIPFQTGVATTIPPERLARWEQFPKPVAVTMTLRKTNGKRATFAVAIDSNDEAKRQRIQVSAEAVVEIATGRVLSLVGTGTFLSPDGDGTMKQRQVTTYK